MRVLFRSPAVAVFWVDAEDHDWAEVASCTVLDADVAARTVTIGSARPPRGAPRSAPPLAPPPPHARDGVTLSRAFAGWMAALLGPLGLVVYDASDPATKPIVADLFARELASPRETSRLARPE